MHMCSSTGYGSVTRMQKQYVVVVSAFVGVGGNLGVVIAGLCLYMPIGHPCARCKAHTASVMSWALLSPLYYCPKNSGMFVLATVARTEEANVAEPEQAVEASAWRNSRAFSERLSGPLR